MPFNYEINADDYFTKNQPAKSEEIANVISITTQPLLPTVYTEIDIYKGNETSIGIETKTITIEFDDYMVSTPSAYLSGNLATTTITSAVYTTTGATIQVTASVSDKFVLTIRGTPTKEIIYESKEDVVLTAGESKTYTCVFDKQPCISSDAVLLENSIDTSITSETHYAWGSIVAVTSTSGDTFKIRIYGIPVIIQGEETIEAQDDESILENGFLRYEFPKNHLIQSRDIAQRIVDKLLESYKLPRKDIELDWRGDPSLVLTDSILVPEYKKGAVDKRAVFYIAKQNLEYDGTLLAKTDGRKLKDE